MQLGYCAIVPLCHCSEAKNSGLFALINQAWPRKLNLMRHYGKVISEEGSSRYND